MIGKGILHEDIIPIQEKLTSLGHYEGSIDAWFGPVMARAVAAFQRAERLFVDGIIGPETAKALAINLDFAKFDAPLLRRSLTAAQLGASTVSSKAMVVKATYYEKLDCVGYHPQLDRLEAIVSLQQSSGYMGGLCQTGSSEHVRFFVDWDGTGVWQDLGLVSFDAHDVPFAGPRKHGVHISLGHDPTSCKTPKLPRVRAILSWREVPPAGDPEWRPRWGNRVNAHIQLPVAPPSPIKPLELGSLGQLGLIPKFKAQLPSKSVVEHYATQKVDIGRWAAPQLAKLAAAKSFSLVDAESLAAATKLSLAELGEVIIKLPSGNPQYERITCVGYDSDRRSVCAVVRVEQTSGYSGSLCDEGSREFVRFWRWDDALAQWVDLGLASVAVHDIPRGADEPLSYAVALPVNLDALRKPCTNGPVIVRVRATLSWNQPPPAGNAEWTPVWGNRAEVEFDLEPGEAIEQPTLLITGIADQPICGLDTGGFYDDASTQDRPFGGYVMLSGHFSQLESLGSNRRLFYRVRVRHPNVDGTLGSVETLSNDFKLFLVQLGSGTMVLVNQTAVDGWYEYRERSTALSEDATLAIWGTHGKNGLASFEIDAELRDSSGAVIETVAVQTAACADVPARTGALPVMLDNRAPTLSLTLQDGACHTYDVGTSIHGTFTIEEPHRAGWGIGVEGGDGTIVNSVTTSHTETANSVSGTWELPTTGMPACGYVVRLSARDRTIYGHYVESATNVNYYVSLGLYASTPSRGFCIKS